MYTQKNSKYLLSNSRAIMGLDHRRLVRTGEKITPNFLRSTSLLYKMLTTNLGTCKLTFYTIYTSHLRWNSSMRHCFYHTGRPRTVSSISQYKLHSFNIQDDRSTCGLLAKPLKKFQNHLYGQPVVIFAVQALGRVFE